MIQKKPQLHIGIVGVGRLGQALATMWGKTAQLLLYDHKTDVAKRIARELGTSAAQTIGEVLAADYIILAVPDRAAIAVAAEISRQAVKTVTLINVATRVPTRDLVSVVKPPVQVISAKFIGHAGEMLLGERPIIIVDEQPAELSAKVQELFCHIGNVVAGDAELVAKINTLAAEEAVKAALHIEQALLAHHIPPPFVHAAIRQVAAGIIKAYVNGTLGPFAQEIIARQKKLQSKQE